MWGEVEENRSWHGRRQLKEISRVGIYLEIFVWIVHVCLDRSCYRLCIHLFIWPIRFSEFDLAGNQHGLLFLFIYNWKTCSLPDPQLCTIFIVLFYHFNINIQIYITKNVVYASIKLICPNIVMAFDHFCFCYSYCEQNYCLRCNPSDVCRLSLLCR